MSKETKPTSKTKTTGEVYDSAVEDLMPVFHVNSGDRPDGLMTNYPNQNKVVEALQLFLDVIIPGKFDTDSLKKKTLKTYLKEKITQAAGPLEKEIVKAIPYRWIGEAACVEGKSCEVENIKKEAAQIIENFVQRLADVRKLVIEDIQAAYQGDPAALTYAEVKLTYPGLLAIATHRLAHELYKLNVPIVPRMMSEWTHTRTGVDINPGAQIGEGFFIDHATGVVIGETTVIGNNVKVYQGVTLGARSFPLDENGNPIKHIKRHPTVEDHVVIYANATILGGDTVIGAGSTIGGNVFLMESVPADSFVATNHPELRIKRRNGS